ncbi:trehalose-phosphatase [Komagataeibacter sucrofermentans]|uniref:Trehalose 6-phosphate phosphatase n=1 Tax=Komagataeibacter sucrofermentans TaxID=1053551 RepID=A0A318QG30_9PROT|nr:trehalose-phosphatase [Komagataeibacter sucrofermentans]PYD78005.1 trehalose-phosphatase [Komagataeibacter sucrofermentans]GBQ51260.1 trehalose phosphatase [Komagataeibacter sucrofermentans DSM 15973]
MSKTPSLPSLDRLPPPARAAFLLDFDGTLVDIAPTPESVVVAPGLRDTLRRLRDKCGNALAVISGRPIEQIDHFLPDVPYAVAGEHGIAIRHAPGQPIERAALPPVPRAWIDEAEKLAASHPGVRIEHKKAGLVLHYRGAPDAGPALGRIADEWVKATSGAFHVQAAKMAWEIRPAGIDKGHAVEAVMQSAPFAGRLPIFVGDDVTDEDGMREAVRLGGVGFRIPNDFPDPAAFRAWLAQLAQGGDGAWGG